jgi:hypothetical protein
MLIYRVIRQILQLLSISLSNTLVRPLLIHEMISDILQLLSTPLPYLRTQRILLSSMSTDSKLFYITILNPHR